jgi:hypothetical protein
VDRGYKADRLVVNEKIVDSISGTNPARRISIAFGSGQQVGNTKVSMTLHISSSPYHIRLLRIALADGACENDVPLEVAQFSGINTCDYKALMKTSLECNSITLEPCSLVLLFSKHTCESHQQQRMSLLTTSCLWQARGSWD